VPCGGTKQWAQTETQESASEHKTLGVREAEGWNRLPREVLEPPSLEVAKRCLPSSSALGFRVLLGDLLIWLCQLLKS